MEEILMGQTQEREISLGKLFWKLLLGWRRCLALGIIFAIVVSSLLYMGDRSVYQANYQAFQKQENGEKIEETDVELTEEELAEVEHVRALQKQIANVRTYLEESTFMKLIPNDMYTLVLQYYVDSDYTYSYTQENKVDYTNAITLNYQSYVLSGVVAQEIKDTLSLEQEVGYINELISAESDTDTFIVKVFYNEAEVLEQMKPEMIKAIENRTEHLNKTIGAHTLKLVEATITTEMDGSVATKQKSYSDLLYNYTVQLNALKGALSSEQLEVLEADEKASVVLAEPMPPVFNIIYAVLGFVVGVFFGCIWILLAMLFATKIQDTEEISVLYDIRNLGGIARENKKKKLFSFVDTFLLNLQNRHKKQLTKEQQFRMLCSNLEIACKRASLNKLYFTGSEIEKIDQTVLAELKKNLSSAGIQVCVGENISYDANSLKEMAEIGCVVFVEQIGLSIYKEIEKEVKIARENAVDILGSIVII